MRHIEPKVRAPCQDVEKEVIDAEGDHLAGPNFHVEETLNDLHVVYEEVDVGFVYEVEVGTEPRECCLQRRDFCIEGRGCEDPVDMTAHFLSSFCDDNRAGSAPLFLPKAPVGVEDPLPLHLDFRYPATKVFQPLLEGVGAFCGCVEVEVVDPIAECVNDSVSWPIGSVELAGLFLDGVRVQAL